MWLDVATTMIFALQTVSPTPAVASHLPMTGAEAERFLRTAEIVEVESFGNRGVTRPKRVTLTDGDITWHAIFKSIDDHAMRKRFDDGTFELHFSDCYSYEIAAYELDKLLDLGMVPPAVERRVGHEKGSLSMWVDGAMTEAERIAADLRPPDLELWNRQMQNLRLFLQLIYDSDYRNINNILVTDTWKVFKIDSSRAFRPWDKLLEPHLELERFSRKVLTALAALDRETLDERLGRLLNKRQLDAVWARRELILELARTKVAEQGEQAVLFD